MEWSLLNDRRLFDQVQEGQDAACQSDDAYDQAGGNNNFFQLHSKADLGTTSDDTNVKHPFDPDRIASFNGRKTGAKGTFGSRACLTGSHGFGLAAFNRELLLIDV